MYAMLHEKRIEFRNIEVRGEDYLRPRQESITDNRPEHCFLPLPAIREITRQTLLPHAPFLRKAKACFRRPLLSAFLICMGQVHRRTRLGFPEMTGTQSLDGPSYLAHDTPPPLVDPERGPRRSSIVRIFLFRPSYLNPPFRVTGLFHSLAS